MIKSSVSQKQLREFGLLIGFGFPLFIGWIIPSIGGHFFRYWSLWVGFPCLILGILKPNLLSFPYKVWMSLGHYLGWLNSRIFLGLTFLLVLLPISLTMRIFGYDPLKRKISNTKTYREEKESNNINLHRIF